MKKRTAACFSRALVAAFLLWQVGSANAVLKDFYDGTLGDADPVSQGWNLKFFPTAMTAQAHATPDPDNDRVQMVKPRRNEQTGADQLNTYELPNTVADGEVIEEIIPAVSDDVYIWEVEAQIKRPEDADADGEPRHELSDFSFISGTDSGSVGFRDRFFFESTDRPGDAPPSPGGPQPLVPGEPPGTESIRMIGFPPLFIDAGFSDTIRPHKAGIDPQPWTNFTSIYDRNVYRFERSGLGLNTAQMFINGDLVFRGSGATSPIGRTQVELLKNSDAMNIYYYRVSVDVEAVGMACDFNADSNCDDVDIDLLASAVRNGTSDSKFNVDGVGDPNIPDDADFDFYITDDSMLSTGFGDHDLDFNVNFVDFVRLSNDFGMNGTGWGQGNGNTDDFTNFVDFVRLSNNFGNNFASGNNVPEPAAGALLAIATLVVTRRYGNRSPTK